jgi:glutathione S-transferase
MKLFMSLTSPYARKVRVLARETGLIARIEEIEVTVSPLSRNPDVAKANPLGKLPTLVLDDGSVLYDSPVVCEYLDSVHGGRELIPAAGSARWAALRLQALADGILDAAVLVRYEVALRPEPLRWPEWIDGQKTKVVAALDTIEGDAAALKGELTIGGISVACALAYLDFRFAADAWRTARPRLAAWFAEIAARDSMRATVPPT